MKSRPGLMNEAKSRGDGRRESPCLIGRGYFVDEPNLAFSPFVHPEHRPLGVAEQGHSSDLRHIHRGDNDCAA